MNNINVKQVAIYAGLALLAYKLFNTKISVSTGLVEKKDGINLNVTGGGTGSSLVPDTGTPKPQPDAVIDVVGPVSTAPINTISPYMGIAPGYNPIYDNVINVVW
ncbi:hypothetical protein HZR02_17590 [Elizabethkingia anophelis]|nr:hypothetical protein [Elizabethkingia anophelis]MCT3660699.1 hypothetical protein [Elizabethkingia anophelis]MCT3667865.1 hypothetical protein [Elizabethkingia anophelis]MCT3853817.1 hypothetical protein [Elizabethkingia anophelis]MCT3864630.1 hypothetical protein [Elizabethkingia anophelis]